MAESEAPSTLLVVVGMLILLGIIFALIMALYGFEIKPQEFINIEEAFPSTLSTESLGSFQMTDLDYDKLHTTSTEVACAIARKIREDFRLYGYTTNRPESSGDYKKVEINEARTIVGRGAFRIKWNAETSTFWKFEDLPAEQQADLMMEGVCLDKGAESWRCDTPYLDEKCVSNGLGHLKITTEADNWLCTAKSGVATKVTAGGALLLFGNEKCIEPAEDGQDTCLQLCPGGDSSSKTSNEISEWRAPGGTGITDYVDDQDWDTVNGWPPYQCISGQCEPLYAWFLVYNKKNKDYEVDMARMAENKNLGGVSSDNLVGILLAGDAKFRDVETAYAYPELRTRYDLTFTPTDQVTFTGLLTKFTDKLNADEKYGKDWNVKIDTCGGDECYDTAPVKQTWKAARVKDPVWPSSPLAYDQAVDNTKTRQALMQINVRTDIQNTDNYLDTTHTYRIVMRWWRRLTEETGYSILDCGGWEVGKLNCVACLEDGGNSINKRWGVDCWNENDDMGGYAEMNKWTRYQDQALIIVDMGEAPAV